MRKPAFGICENKDADQLRGNREADQRLCFRYIDSKIPLLTKSKISSSYPSSVTVQPGLCETWSQVVGNPKDQFSHNEAHLVPDVCSRAVFTLCLCRQCLSLRKPVFGVSHQVRHKPGCTATEDCYRLEILDLGSRGTVLSM